MNKTVLIVLLVLIAIVLGGFGWWFLTKGFNRSETEKIAVSVTSTPSTQKTYENSNFGFSFKYPDTFVKYDAQMSNGTGQLFAISYRDPAREKEILVNDCVMNESVSWQNSTPKQADCTQTLANLTQTEKTKILDSIDGPLLSKSIIVQVFDDSVGSDIKTWLTNRYKQANTELENYVSGKQITMGGETGYFSNIGCCAGYIVNYAVKHGDKIYILNTNYKDADTGSGTTEDNTFLQDVAETFEFTK